MKFDPMAFQNIIQVFLCIFFIFIQYFYYYDWITIMGYSKHEHVVLPKKIVKLPPYLPILGHLSTMATLILLSLRWPLWRGLTVVFISSIIIAFNK